jgi:predicted dehydrogenase
LDLLAVPLSANFATLSRPMSDALRYMLIGTGGTGAHWCRFTLPLLAQAGKAVCAAAVDSNPEALKQAQQYLNVPAEHCFTDIHEAFDRRRADFMIIAAPTHHHEKLIELALLYDLHVLCEAPLADTFAGCCRIYFKARRAKTRKIALVTTSRFDQDKHTLEQLVRGHQYGRLGYLVGRFTTNLRKRPAWGRRHDMIDPLLIEGAVHHFELFRALCGGDARSVYAASWNPGWADYRGDTTALVTIEMRDGTHCSYEGSVASASTISGLGNEYLRAECEQGTLELDRRRIHLYRGDAWEDSRVASMPLAERPIWGNTWIVEQFCDWLRGGAKPANRLKEQIQTMAMVFAAVESAHTGRVVDVQELLNRHLAEV